MISIAGARPAGSARAGTGSLIDRAASVVERRTSRRGFVGRSALVGSALVVSGSGFVLRPRSAYAAICSCPPSASADKRSCDCNDLCCGGYTEFCCHLYGHNACPDGTLLAGWWKVDNSTFCDGAARYYMDCNAAAPACSCGSGGVCRDGNVTCQCRSCDSRRDGCTVFRYGNCNNDVACVGPIVCRVVTCSKPWELDPGCSTVSRTDPATAGHHRGCLEPVIEPTDEDRAWARAVHVDYLGREGGVEEVEDLARRVAVGNDRIGTAVAFSRSDTYIKGVLDGLYERVFERAIDPEGAAYWTDRLQAGTTVTEVAALLYGSDEFFARSGSIEGFVTRLYEEILGRAPDGAGSVYWQEVAADPALRPMVGGFFHDSIESRSRRVADLYQLFLGRAPDAAGQAYWIEILRSGDDLELATFLSASDEYHRRAQTRFG